MKKKINKRLIFKKRTVSKLEILDQIRGGNNSETSCLCQETVCECKPEITSNMVC